MATGMTLDDLGARFDKLAAEFTRLEKNVSAQFTRFEQKMDQGFNDSKIRDQKLDEKLEQGLNDSKIRDQELQEKLDQGLNDSKIRDEQLLAKTQFGLEARAILRDEMHRRFDEADRKHDEQIDLLKVAVSARARR